MLYESVQSVLKFNKGIEQDVFMKHCAPQGQKYDKWKYNMHTEIILMADISMYWSAINIYGHCYKSIAFFDLWWLSRLSFF